MLKSLFKIFEPVVWPLVLYVDEYGVQSLLLVPTFLIVVLTVGLCLTGFWGIPGWYGAPGSFVFCFWFVPRAHCWSVGLTREDFRELFED